MVETLGYHNKMVLALYKFTEDSINCISALKETVIMGMKEMYVTAFYFINKKLWLIIVTKSKSK